jgi:hypothetical protein
LWNVPGRSTDDALTLLQRWYLSRCDGEWEHRHGVTIESLDNPGWRVTIDLAGLPMAGTGCDWAKIDRSEHDWLHWRVADQRFEGGCGATNLGELIGTFLVAVAG